MKNIVTFYISIIAPLALLLVLNKYEIINPTLFIILMLGYTLIYRTYTDGKRLADKNIITKKHIWKLIIPGNRLEHFKELYLK